MAIVIAFDRCLDLRNATHHQHTEGVIFSRCSLNSQNALPKSVSFGALTELKQNIYCYKCNVWTSCHFFMEKVFRSTSL